MTEESQTPWKLSLKVADLILFSYISIAIEAPDKNGVEELLKTVKKEMVK